MDTKEIISRIFKDPATQYELIEFENLDKPIHNILAIYPKTAATGREAGKIKYYLKSFIPFSSGNEEVQVYVENGNLIEDHDGQPKINKDLVNYDLAAADLADAAKIPDEQLCIAEAFVRFARQQGLEFWRKE